MLSEHGLRSLGAGLGKAVKGLDVFNVHESHDAASFTSLVTRLARSGSSGTEVAFEVTSRTLP